MDENSRENSDPLAKSRKTIRRIGWGIVVLGLLLAFTAALIGGAAARGSNPSTVESAMVLRNIAAVVMLIGLVAQLIAQRLEAVREWFRRRIERNSDQPGPVESTQIGSILCWTIILLAFWLAAGGFPAAVRGRWVVLASVAVPAVATLLVVQLRGTFRAFLAGVLLAAIGNLAVVGLAVIVLTGDVGSIRAARELGRYFYPFTTVMWFVAVLFGLLGVALRHAFVNKTHSDSPTE